MRTMTQMKRQQNRRLTACIVGIATMLPAIVSGLDLRAKIDPLAKPLLDDGVVVGFVVGIVKDGETQVIPYGVTRKGSQIAPDGDAVYEIGSVSKAFTGVLLADMVQRGIVQLEDPVQKYLPPDVTMPVAEGKPITLEHLATHTSGLPRLPDNLAPADPSNPYADYSEAQLFSFLPGHTLRRPPGEHEYSNYGMGLLGHVLATKAGKTYEELLIDRICKPLGMEDTRITLNADQRKRFATPYTAALKPAHAWDIPTLAGAGGIRSTCNDMITFMQANLADDEKPLTKALRLSHQKRHAMESGLAMGLGWHIARDGITRWHNGMTGGFHGWLSVVPEHGVGVVVLANTANRKITQFGELVTRVAFGIDVEPAKERTAIEVDSDVLASYAGDYVMVPQFVLTVTVEEGQLMVQATGQQKLPVFAESKTIFFYKAVNAQISFVPGEDGKIDQLILHQGGLNQKAVRKD